MIWWMVLPCSAKSVRQRLRRPWGVQRAGSPALGHLRRKPVGEALIGEGAASGADQPRLEAGRLRRLDRPEQLRRDRHVHRLRTVRTIVERKRGADRTTKARREKIEIDKFQRAHWKAQKRTGDALPKRVANVIETGNALVSEAKGLGRGR
jgi:hypothetical protein